MKLNCGLSWKDRIDRFNLRMSVKHDIMRRVWVKKFAMWPVRVGKTECRWLEYVQVNYPEAKLYSYNPRTGDILECLVIHAGKPRYKVI